MLPGHSGAFYLVCLPVSRAAQALSAGWGFLEFYYGLRLFDDVYKIN